MLRFKPQKQKSIVLVCSMAILAIMLPICALTIWFFNILSERTTQQEVNCATLVAEPISDTVINDLCTRNLIPASLGSCDRDTFRIRDIMPIVESHVTEDVSTFGDVTTIFGEYERYCEQKSTRRSEFRCDYLFGRWPSIFIFYNSSSEVVTRVTTVSCTGGS